MPFNRIPLLLAVLVAAPLAGLPGAADVARAQTVATAPPATQVLPDFADLAERAGPAVVNIRTTARASRGRGANPMPDLDPNDPFFEFFRRFFPPGTQPEPAGQSARSAGTRGIGTARRRLGLRDQP